MTIPSEETSFPVAPAVPPKPAGGHRGLLAVAALLATCSALAAGGYGWRTGQIAPATLAIEFLLVAIGCWTALHACRIRCQMAEARQVAVQRQAAPAVGRRFHDPEDDTDERFQADFVLGAVDHERMLERLFLLLSTLTAAACALGLLWRSAAWASSGTPIEGTTLGVLGLAVSCLWLVLSKTFAAMRDEELPESTSLSLAFREAQWASILIAVAVFGSQFWGPLGLWGARVLATWTVLVAVEQGVRVLARWFRGEPVGGGFAAPLRLMLREAVFVRGNPLASLFDQLETQWGVSFRSSWAIRFVRNASVPVLALAAFLLWSLDSLSMVGLGEMGLRESFGRMQGEPLGPGLQWKLPWPFGRVLRFPVKQVRSQPVGFTVGAAQPVAYLWTKSHSKEEFALVLGDGTEAVAVNAMIYYKIREDREGFLDYVLGFQNPDLAIETFAYRVLMEQTRGTTLKGVLSANRAEFARHLRDSLRRYALENRLGIEVVEVALLSLHPPIEAAADYLAVISARIDANRSQIEAGAESLVRLQASEKTRGSTVATAKVDAARRVAGALEESGTFTALGAAFGVAPESFKLRAWFETFEDVLSSKPLVLIDKTFVTGRGEILLDMRNGARSSDVLPTGGRKEP